MCREYLYSLATDKKKGFFANTIKFFLFILSLVYGLSVRILFLFYRIKPCKLNCKVISVGNITLGGTGKTSLVQLLAEFLKEAGYRIAVLSRGYRRPFSRHPSFGLSYETMGDEAYMLSRNLDNIAVIVDKDRIRAAQKAIRDYKVDSVILDDGFQQWRIKKDLDIVTIDATNPLGNSHLLPRGIMREPLSSLKRADIFILTKVNLKSDNQRIKELLNNINPEVPIIEALYEPAGFYKIGRLRDNLLEPHEFLNKRVTLVCGIADPQSFENIITKLGINIGLSFRFADHHIYTEKDFDKIISESKQKGISIIITTEKDSVRFINLRHLLLNMDCFVLRIRLELLQYESFIERIHSLYQS